MNLLPSRAMMTKYDMILCLLLNYKITKWKIKSNIGEEYWGRIALAFHELKP
jgi:hypothetical protein